MQPGDGAETPYAPRIEGVVMMTTRKPRAPKLTTVAAAVEGEIVTIAKRAPNVASSSMAAVAVALARDIDAPKTSATARSAGARALCDAMAQLRALVPAEKTSDRVDDLAARRAKRLASRAKASK